MKYIFLVLSFFVLSQVTHADEVTKTEINYSTTDRIKEALKKLSFGYSAIYLGPSLSSDAETNKTFNRFKSGQGNYNEELDHTGAYQVYHATNLSYRFTSNIVLSYGFTFQEDLHRVSYEYTYKDINTGQLKTATGERGSGLSYNDQLLSLWFGNIYENSILDFNLGLVYQIPTTEGSKANDMLYGIGARPSVSLKNNTPGLYTGISSEIIRFYYKREEFQGTYIGDFDGKVYNNDYITKPQTLSLTLSPYANYSLSDKWQLKTSLVFDWDQDGRQIHTNEFNDNMTDVGNIGLAYFANLQTTIGASLQFALEDPSVEKSAISFSLNLTI